MSFLDLYQGDQDQAARMQPNEGTRLPSGFGENLHAAWSDGQLFSQSIARSNARAAVLGDYIDEIRQKTGNDLSKEFIPDVAGGGQTGVTDFDTANARVAKLKESYPELDLAPLSEDEIDKRAVAKSQAAHRTYQNLEAGEKTLGGSVGSFLGSAGSAAADPINIIALGIAPETGGASILSAALRWGALAGVSQAAIEAASDTFKEQVQPGYTESGEPIKEIGGAFIGGAVLGGGFKALGNAWTRVKTGAWPTSVRDAGNVIESEANVAETNPFPGVAGEVAHREALVKTIDDVNAGRPVDVSAQITPDLVKAATEAERAKIVPEPPSGQPEQLALPLSPETEPMAPKRTVEPGPQPVSQTAEEIQKTLTAPDHQDAIRADIDRAIAEHATGGHNTPRAGLSVEEIANKNKIRIETLSPNHSVFMSRVTGEPGGPGVMKIRGPHYDSADHSVNLPDMPDAEFERTYGATKEAVTAHEVAHGLLDKWGMTGSIQGKEYKDLRAELTEASKNFRQDVWDQAPKHASKSNELMTDGLAVWMTNPEARANMPLFKKMMGTRLDSFDVPRAKGELKVPGIDDTGNHTMVSVDAAIEEVDAYKKLADDIQACAAPAQEAAE